jgi:hypothetical protein
MTINALSTATGGNYTVTITGTGGGVTESTTMPLTVYVFTVSASPTSLSVAQGNSGTITISDTITSGIWDAPVPMTVTGQPAGATASFPGGIPTVIPNGSNTMTLAAAPTTAAGTYTITISGAFEGVTKTATVALTVTPVPPILGLGTPNTIPMFVGTSSLSNSVITQSGNNVGIGTASPGAPLDVYGLIQSTTSGTVNSGVGPALSLYNPAKTTAGMATYWRIYNMSGSYGNSLQFWDYDTIGCASGGMCASRLTLMDNGNVGIGTTAPGAGYKLDVEGGPINSSGGYCIAGSCISSWPTGGANTWTSTQTFTSAPNSSWIGSVTALGGGGTVGYLAGQEGGQYWTGVAGQSSATNGVGVYGLATNATGSGGYFTNSAGGPAIVTGSGDVGIGTINPTAPLTVYQSGLYNSGTQRFIDFSGDFAGTNPSTTSNAGALTAIRIGDTNYAGKYAMIGSVSEDPIGYSRMTGLSFWTSTQDTAPLERMRITSGGNVGIGTTTPGAALEVNGVIKLTASKGGSIMFQDGTTQSTAYTGVACGGDYAESVDVTGERTKYEPGDVLVIDPKVPGKFLKSNEAYSTLVTGVYSTKPGTVGRRQATAKSPDEVPMAMVGIVPIKVTAENGAIKTGDLLVASSTLGRAMKGTDRSKMLGAVIGKALGSLDSGTGVIEMVVTLQ